MAVTNSRLLQNVAHLEQRVVELTSEVEMLRRREEDIIHLAVHAIRPQNSTAPHQSPTGAISAEGCVATAPVQGNQGRAKKRQKIPPKEPVKQTIGAKVEFDPAHPEWSITAPELRRIFANHPDPALQSQTKRGRMFAHLGIERFRTQTHWGWRGLRELEDEL